MKEKNKTTITTTFTLVLLTLVVILLSILVYVGIGFMRADKVCIVKKTCKTAPGQLNKYTQTIVQPVTFYAQQSADNYKGIARKGVLFRKPGARATILICHGFMCDKTDVRFLRMIFSDYNVMIFDFRGHGEVPGHDCCTFGCNEVYDIKGAASFIKSDPELQNLPLIVYGFSMGAVSSINAQAQDNSLFNCAVWDCPFDSTEGIISRSIENLKVTLFGHVFALPGRSFLKKYAYNPYVQAFLKGLLKTIAQADATAINTRMMPLDTVKQAEKISIPALFITCNKDDKAPPEAVRKVYEAAQGYKRFWVTNGRRHFDSFFHNPDKYAYKVRRFIEKFLDNNFAEKVQAREYHDELGE